MPLKTYMTEKDHATLRFVEENKSITVSQCAKLFYDNQIYKNQYANKKLSKLVRYGKLKVFRDISGNENVYYMTQKLNYHDLLSLDYYVELKHHGAEIIYFKREQEWMKGTDGKYKYFSDAYCCYVLNNKVYFDIIEVVRTNGLDKDKYINLYESKEPQKLNDYIYEQIGGTSRSEFPRIVLIDNTQHKEDYLYINKDINIIQLDFKLTNFYKIFLQS